jgi:hypothetical protein
MLGARSSSNGIAELAVRPDLIDCSILVTLPTIADDMEEEALESMFEQAWPSLLGACLDAFLAAYQREPTRREHAGARSLEGGGRGIGLSWRIATSGRAPRRSFMMNSTARHPPRRSSMPAPSRTSSQRVHRSPDWLTPVGPLT